MNYFLTSLTLDFYLMNYINRKNNKQKITTKMINEMIVLIANYYNFSYLFSPLISLSILGKLYLESNYN